MVTCSLDALKNVFKEERYENKKRKKSMCYNKL